MNTEKIIEKCSTINQRGRHILREGRIAGYIMNELLTHKRDLRLFGKNADETAEIFFSEIKKDQAHYEFENGSLHLFCN